MLSARGGLKSISVIAILFAMVETRYAAMDFASTCVSKSVAVQSVPEINAVPLATK
jgi:hypothetical protein